MKKIKPEKIMRKELKEKMENRLLVIMAVCMAAYIGMLFAHRGFLGGSTVLLMKPIMYCVGGAFLLAAVVLAVIYFINKVSEEVRERCGNYAIVTAVIGVCAFFVSVFNIHGVKILAVALTVYLIDAIVYYSYYLEFRRKRKLLNILFGAQFIVLCASWFVLFFFQKLSAIISTIISILMPTAEIAPATISGVNIGIGVVLGLIGLWYLVRGLFLVKDSKNADL